MNYENLRHIIRTELLDPGLHEYLLELKVQETSSFIRYAITRRNTDDLIKIHLMSYFYTPPGFDSQSDDIERWFSEENIVTRLKEAYQDDTNTI